MTFFPAVSGLVLAGVCAVMIYGAVAEQRRISMLVWATLGVAGFFGIGWALIVTQVQLGDTSQWSERIQLNRADWNEYALFAFLLLVAIWLGWYLAEHLGRSSRARVGLSKKVMEITPGFFATVAWVALALAIVLQLIYSAAYGGPFKLLEYSVPIRSGVFPIYNPASFLQPFGGLALLACYIFCGLLIVPAFRWSNLVGFLAALLVSVYILYSWLWRTEFAVLAVTLILPWLMARDRNPYRQVAYIALAPVVGLAVIYAVSYLTNIKFTSGVLAFAAKELSFYPATFLTYCALDPTPFRWFYDLYMAPAFALPIRWSPIALDYLDVVSTILLLGAPKGVDGQYGAIPTDLLTLGFLQAPVAGVAVVGALFGVFLRVIDWCVEAIPHAGVRLVASVNLGLKIGALSCIGATPVLLIRNNYYVLLGTGLVVAGLVLKTILDRRQERSGASRSTA